MDREVEEHLEPTTEISLDVVKKRSLRGVVVLTGGGFVLQVIGLIGQGILWAFLGASEWGLFLLLNAIVNFLNYFSDIGLAAALIQKKEQPSEEDLRTTFLVQQALVVVIIGIIAALVPFFTKQYSLTSEGQYLLYALSLSLFLSSLKSIPSVLLERKLEFIKLVFPKILEQVIYYLVLVFLAVKGVGVTSFTIAVVVRDIVGLTLIYLLQPWKLGFAFSKRNLSHLFKFGIPYQINTLLATVKDDGMTIILGKILGSSGIGFLGWAQKVARYPLTFFMDNVTRVTFPAFSRMQDARQELEKSVTKSIFFICFLAFPSIAGLVILAPPLLILIPRYSKWEPALIPLIFVSINYLFAAATTQLTNLLNAIGKIKITFFLMIMWTVLTWAVVPFLALRYGVNGASIGYAIVGASSTVAVYITKKYINFSISDSIVKPLLGTLAMAVVVLILRSVLPTSYYSLGLLILVGILVYGVVMIGLIGASLIADAKKSIRTVFAK